MLQISVTNPVENKQFDHPSGPLEFGRGPRRQAERYIVDDPYVSRDHVRIEEIEDNTLRVENLSSSNPVQVGSVHLNKRETCIVRMPTQLTFGRTIVGVIRRATVPAGTMPALSSPSAQLRKLKDLGASPDAATLADWFETVISVQHAAVSSADFHRETARAIVELVGLDKSLVLLKADSDWQVATAHCEDGSTSLNYSRSIVAEVTRTKQTYWRNLDAAPVSASLENIETVVAAPIFSPQREVIGVLYGSRGVGIGKGMSNITALEAQIVQVLAAAASAGMARQIQAAEALRAQVQFEQFFSPALTQELARDQTLLEGREREITVLFSELRSFASVSNRLGPRETCRLIQDVMELQTAAINEEEGVVVDYYGDGLMAMWNAPSDQADHAERACRAAIAIAQRIPTLAERWEPILGHALALGIGINTGMALVGNTGSRAKFKYGPIGPTVNLANRVEQATKPLGVPVIITESTCKRLGPTLDTRRLCHAQLAGLVESVPIYELRTEELTPAWNTKRDAFEAALALYEGRRFTETCEAIHPLLKAGHRDIPSLLLLSRAVECMRAPPKDFKPVLYSDSV